LCRTGYKRDLAAQTSHFTLLQKAAKRSRHGASQKENSLPKSRSFARHSLFDEIPMIYEI
jgi:hypothetical protein